MKMSQEKKKTLNWGGRGGGGGGGEGNIKSCIMGLILCME